MKKLIIIFGFALLLLACGELPDEFTITYNDNGSTSGFPPVDKNKYTSGSYATVLDKNTLKKDEYEFDGWNTKSDNSGTHYKVGDRIEIKNINIFLYAVWKN